MAEKTRSELVKIIVMSHEEQGPTEKSIDVAVPWGCGRYASAAMLRGAHDFFFKPMNQKDTKYPDGILKIGNEGLKEWENILNTVKELVKDDESERGSR